MFKSQKNVFWEALLVTILIFGIGILAGFFLENMRTNQINSLFQQSEIDLLDIRLQNEIYSDLEFNCDIAIEENLNFANRIYEEAQKLANFFGQSNISLRFPRFGLIKTRTDNGKKLFACPIKVDETNDSMFVDMIGEFELGGVSK